jgi:hypothetical protein
MWRSKHNLTARRVETAKPGRYGDGGGLYLIVSATGARKWVYRFTFGGRVTKMGIGSVRVVPLAEARDRAHERASFSKGARTQLRRSGEQRGRAWASPPLVWLRMSCSPQRKASGGTKSIKPNGSRR